MRVLFLLNESLMFERLGVMYLSSALKKAGHETRLAYANELGQKKLNRLMHTYAPQVVAYSIMTGEHREALAHVRQLKTGHNFISVFGGPHPSFFPDFINEHSVDAICIGEGDLAFPDFCERLQNKKAYWETKNFHVKVDGKVYKNGLYDLIEDLDSLPYPDRELMYTTDWKLAEAGPKLFTASRGCPYDCTYCFNHRYNEMYKNKGKILRHHSPQNVISEILQVKNAYQMAWTYFVDDTFLLKPDGWIKEFCSLYKEKVDIPFCCSVRANIVDSKVLTLKNAGLWGVWMGIECANDESANNILRRNMDKEVLLKAVKLLHKNDIKICAQNIVGLPVKNAFEIDKETLDFNILIKPDFALASILYPYPNTEIEAYSRTTGFLKPGATILETNKTSSMLTFSSKLEKRKIENLHKLFTLFVWFPYLRRFCDFLCTLPLPWLYRLLFYLSYGYGFKMKMSPPNSFSIHKDVLNYFGLFFRMLKKT